MFTLLRLIQRDSVQDYVHYYVILEQTFIYRGSGSTSLPWCHSLCSYRSLEWTNQTLAIESALSALLYASKGQMGGLMFSWLQ